MRSALKLFLATAAILNAAAVFGGGETFSENGEVSTRTPSMLPTYEEMKQNPEHAKEMLINTASNKNAAFGVRYTAVHRLHYILKQPTEAAQLARALGLESRLKLNEKMSILNLLSLIKNTQMAAAVAIYKGIAEDSTSTVAQKLNAAERLMYLDQKAAAVAIYKDVGVDSKSTIAQKLNAAGSLMCLDQQEAAVAIYKGIGADSTSTIAQKLEAAYLLKELGCADDSEVIFRAVVADPASRSDEIFEANEEIASLLSRAN